MFGIGMPEMILILAVALIVIGPKKLPDLAKSLGKAMGEFKKATRDLKDSMQIDTELKEVKDAFDDISKDEPQKATVAAGRMEDPPADDAASKVSAEAVEPDNNDSMDRLKAVFDHRNTGADDTPLEAGKNADEPGPEPALDSETHKA